MSTLIRRAKDPSTARGHRAFTLIDTMLVVVILGILAAIALPQFANVQQQAREAAVSKQLQTIRSQVALYESENPGATFNPMVPGGLDAWDQLVDNRYIMTEPMNVLQANATRVSVFPAVGVGWVWSDLGDGVTIYAVDENAGFFDGDGDGEPD